MESPRQSCPWTAGSLCILVRNLCIFGKTVFVRHISPVSHCSTPSTAIFQDIDSGTYRQVRHPVLVLAAHRFDRVPDTCFFANVIEDSS